MEVKVGRSPKLTKFLKENFYSFEEVDLFDDPNRGYYEIHGNRGYFQRDMIIHFPDWHFDYCNIGSNSFLVGRVRNWSQLSDRQKFDIMEWE